jgi:ubiquitin-conjugating enzyme E2 variant
MPVGAASHRTLERAAIALASALLAWLGWRLARVANGAADLLAVAAALLASHAAADLLSGLVHWLADRILPERLPYLGRHFVQPFREHHRDPLAITRHGFVETNGNNCIATLPLLAALAARPGPEEGDLAAVAGSAFGLGLAGWICLTNQVHQWAHRPCPPGLVTRLQALGLLLSPEHHRLHHRHPFDGHFCITSGWFDAPLERMRLLPRLERGLLRLGAALFSVAGRRPRGTMRPPEGAPAARALLPGDSGRSGSEGVRIHRQ